MTLTFEPTPPTKTMAEVMADITSRLAIVRERYDNFAQGCNRRSTSDSLYDVKQRLAAVQRWLSGDNDQPIAFFRQASTQEGRDPYRIHYAADSLVGAEVSILAAEFHAGLKTMDEAEAESPWRFVDGKTSGEQERLRLAEGITWIFPQTVLGK